MNDTYLMRIAVIDSGIGIKEEDQSKLFKFFGKVGANNEVINPTGIGLGLTICSNILEQLKSELRVKSQLNKGSTFYFDIPLTSIQIK